MLLHSGPTRCYFERAGRKLEEDTGSVQSSSAKGCINTRLLSQYQWTSKAEVHFFFYFYTIVISS